MHRGWTAPYQHDAQVRTVEYRITSIYGTIGAHGKADAAAHALQHGLDAKTRR